MVFWCAPLLSTVSCVTWVHHAVIVAYICCWADVLPFLLLRCDSSHRPVLVFGGSSGFISPWSRRLPIAVCVLYHHAGFEAYISAVCAVFSRRVRGVQELLEHCCFIEWTSLRDAELKNCRPYNYRYCDRRMWRMWWCMLLVSVHSVFLQFSLSFVLRACASTSLSSLTMYILTSGILNFLISLSWWGILPFVYFRCLDSFR